MPKQQKERNKTQETQAMHNTVADWYLTQSQAVISNSWTTHRQLP